MKGRESNCKLLGGYGREKLRVKEGENSRKRERKWSKESVKFFTGFLSVKHFTNFYLGYYS